MHDGLLAATLLLFSNVFMTTAWYGHLRFPKVSMPVRILSAWGIAFFEYVLQVPANHIGHRVWTAYQLKIVQEALSLAVFVVFSAVVLGERLTPRYGMSLALVFAGVALAVKR